MPQKRALTASVLFSGWDQYLSELDSYRVDRYIEIYKAATGR